MLTHAKDDDDFFEYFGQPNPLNKGKIIAIIYSNKAYTTFSTM